MTTRICMQDGIVAELDATETERFKNDYEAFHQKGYITLTEYKTKDGGGCYINFKAIIAVFMVPPRPPVSAADIMRANQAR